MKLPIQHRSAGQSRSLSIITLTLTALVFGGFGFYYKYYRKVPPPRPVEKKVETNTVAEVKVEVDLFPGRRNAHGIFYVPIKEARETSDLLAAAEAAKTNNTAQVEAKP